MSDTVHRAEKLFGQGFSCSQAVIAAIAETRGIDTALVLRMAAAFGGGHARSGDTCGAVSGALMAVGLEHGGVSPKDRQASARCYDVGEEFLKRFRQREGSLSCRDLLGYDLSVPEQARKARAKGLFSTVCPRVVSTAVQVVEELLIERPGKPGLHARGEKGPAR